MDQTKALSTNATLQEVVSATPEQQQAYVIAKLSIKDAALVDAQKESDKFPEITADNLKGAKTAKRNIVSLRTGLEKSRKEFKEPVVSLAKLIDSTAKQFHKKIEAIEEPFAKRIQDFEDEEKRKQEEAERIERERVAGIQSRIEQIKGVPSAMIGQPADRIENELAHLREIIPSRETFHEFIDDGAAALQLAKQQLESMVVQARESEQAKQNAAIDAILRDIPTQAMQAFGKSAAEIRQAIAGIERHLKPDVANGERADEVVQAATVVHGQLQQMLTAAEAQEAAEREKQATEAQEKTDTQPTEDVNSLFSSPDESVVGVDYASSPDIRATVYVSSVSELHELAAAYLTGAGVAPEEVDYLLHHLVAFGQFIELAQEAA